MNHFFWYRVSWQFKLKLVLVIVLAITTMCALTRYHYADRSMHYMLGPLKEMAEEETMEKEFKSLFKTPVEKVKISKYNMLDGSFYFQVISVAQPLVLKENRSMHKIDSDYGILGRGKEPWMTHCYFQPHYSSPSGADIWVYTDVPLSQAYIIGKLAPKAIK